MKGIIYGYYQPASKKWYIGQTTNEERRKNSFYTDKYYTTASENNISKIDNARHKYNPKTFNYYILFSIELTDIYELTKILNEKESFYIKKYNSYKLGYNGTEGGGENSRGFIANEDYRKKCSERYKGEKNPFYGKHHTEETRKYLSDLKKGIIKPIKTKKCNISYVALRGQKRSEKTKLKDSLSQPNRKEIIAYNDNEEYEFHSIAEGARFVNGNHTNISKCLKGSYFDKRTNTFKNAFTYKGYKWKYKNGDIRKFVTTGEGSEGYKRMIETCYKNGRKASIKVNVFDINHNFIETCESLKSCSIKYNVNITQIKRVCEGGFFSKKRNKFVNYRQAKGYVFEYFQN